MKKIGRFLLLSFSFILSLIVLNSNNLVEAKTTTLYQNNESLEGCKKEDQQLGNPNATFWEILCAPYTVIEGKEDTNTSKYQYSNSNQNFEFNYDYEIEFDITKGYIRDYTSYVTRFIGITESTTITYRDIQEGYYHTDDSFVVYKYNNVTGYFEVINTYPVDSSGSHVIDAKGIYKLETSIDGGSNPLPVYVVYADGFYYSSLREIVYDSRYETLEYKLAVNTPEKLSCASVLIRINANTLSGIDCNVNDGYRPGEYEVEITTVVPGELSYINNKRTDLSFNGTNFSTNITYDSADPELDGDIIYYPEDMPIEEFAIIYNDAPLTLPRRVLVEFSFQDNNDVTVSINGRSCSLKQNVARCVVTSNDGDELTYKIVDTYGNETAIMHQDISYSGENIHDVNELKEYININGAEIEFTNLDEYSELNKICLVYGDDVSSFVCANSTSTLILRTYKYYKGPITVVLADESTNIYKVLFENVTLNNGYHIEDFEYEGIEGDIYNEYEVTSEVSDLVALACDSEEDCMDTIKVYASYGDAEKLLSNNANYSTIKLPTYLEMINAGFTSKSCAFQRCDETIEVYVQYEIGGVEQRISAKYSYIDKLPQMSYVMDQYEPTRSYNFSELNLNNLYTQRELFATAFPITLEDGEGNTYNAQIHSRFIKYIDREGNVSPINNALYTYIGNNNKNFGYYLLEGYVKVLNEDIYGKSFFIMVELADKDAPVLTLVGEETMKIKQYDVFKDPEFNCNDASECHTTIKYYYQNENNEVEEIDTNVYGKYIIKYTAVDGDGNVTTLTRIVEVESVNAMNATSIIIIVAVVVLLVGSIVIAIIIEKKKNKEED